MKSSYCVFVAFLVCAAVAHAGDTSSRLRARISQDVSGGKQPMVLVDVMGRTRRGKLIAAGDTGITVRTSDGETNLSWEEITPRQLLRIAYKVLGRSKEDLTLLAEYSLASNLPQEASKLDKSLAHRIEDLQRERDTEAVSKPVVREVASAPRKRKRRGGARMTGRWEPIGLCGGGAMFAPAISPVDPKLMMINCDMSGVYRTLDGGHTWRMMHHSQLRANKRCRPGFHPQDPRIIYASNGYWGKLRKSTDQGEHWTDIADIKHLLGEIAFDPEDPSLMLTGRPDGIWLSRNGGKTWTHCTGPTGNGVAFRVDRTSPKQRRAIFGATTHGIWHSSDTGKTWAKKSNGLPGGSLVSFAAGFKHDPKQVGMLYCVMSDGKVYRSVDRGEHWESAMGQGLCKDVSYRHVLATDVDPLLVYVMNRKAGDARPPRNTSVYRSQDGGKTWQATFFCNPRFAGFNAGYNWESTASGTNWQEPPQGAAICPGNPNWLIRTGGRAHVTEDGGRTWRSAHSEIAPGRKPTKDATWVCNGLVVTTTWHYYIDPFEPNRHYIAYTDICFALSHDSGRTWKWMDRSGWPPWWHDCYEVAFDSRIPGKMWAAFSDTNDIPNANTIMGHHPVRGGGVCVSTDFGVHWKHAAKGLPTTPATSVIVDPSSEPHKRVLYASMYNHGVYKSIDDGKTWTRKSQGLPSKTAACRLIRHQDGTLFVLVTAKVAGGRFITPGPGVYRSTDEAESWQCMTTSLSLVWPKDFSVHPESSKIIFVGAADGRNGGAEQGGLYRTLDGGATWKRVARKGPQHFGAYFHPKHPDWVYMTLTERAPGPGLWLSQDRGETWEPFVEGLPFRNIQRVAFDPTDDSVIYVTTFGGSVWKGPAVP